jgi:hypothetical protein
MEGIVVSDDALRIPSSSEIMVIQAPATDRTPACMKVNIRVAGRLARSPVQ